MVFSDDRRWLLLPPPLYRGSAENTGAEKTDGIAGLENAPGWVIANSHGPTRHCATVKLSHVGRCELSIWEMRLRYV